MTKGPGMFDSNGSNGGTGTSPAHAYRAYVFRQPTGRDGERVWRLIADCPPLDENSLYCNLLQCTHFSDTCLLAEDKGALRGWVSAYRPPNDPETLFVWQIAVHPKARGSGLGRALIRELLARPAAEGVKRLRTTVTADNHASWALFESVAGALNAPIDRKVWFSQDIHFRDTHPSEHLITIGPIPNRNAQFDLAAAPV